LKRIIFMKRLAEMNPAFTPVSRGELLAVEGGGLWSALYDIARTIVRVVLRPGVPTT
jgi:hypothetical protein